MSPIQIGGQEWDFVDAEGGETSVPPETKASVHLPTVWRVFGPASAQTTELKWKKEADCLEIRCPVEAAVPGLTEIPDVLSVGAETFRGRDVAMVGDMLDLDVALGANEMGQQAYAMAELVIDRETDVLLGAGCHYWMQWWIDGELVCDTLATGNRHSTVSRTDRCFGRHLRPGRHLLVVRAVRGWSGWTLRAGAASRREAASSAVAFSNRWELLPDLQEIRPPAAEYWVHTMAIRTDICLAEETIQCECQQPIHGGLVGIIFGAQDSGHYYYAYVPVWGQLWRARAFYAAIAIADGSGYLRNLRMELMPNVPGHWNVWRSLKVQRRGNEIQMWVGGVRGPCVRDDTYGAGRPGVGGFSKYKIRNLKIDGKAVPGPAWKAGDFRGHAWLQPISDLTLGDFQAPGPLLKLSDDEVIMPVRIGRDSGCHRLNAENSALYFYHSHDGGRSWSQYAGPIRSTDRPPGAWLVLDPGVIRATSFDPDHRRFLYQDSTDKGLTWTEPESGRLLGDWTRDILREKTWNGLFGFRQLNDGTLLAVILHGYEGIYHAIPRKGQGTWGTEVAQPYCTLSRDRGLTWSEPVPMDNAALNDGDTPDSPCGGFSETAVAQLPGGRIVALARPFRSPFMWQTQSEDGGKTWRQACYAPFSGAGGPQMVATRSGYLAIITRGPGLCLHFSSDEGVNWDYGTVIDFPDVFNGSAIEVEPDVILVVYPQSMDEIRPSFVRVQRIRLTARGPVPLNAD